MVPIQGDIMLPGLGVGAQDAATLISRVSVVFHAAATVKFDEALKLSLQMNVLGTKRLVELCHKMERLVVRRKKGRRMEVMIWEKRGRRDVEERKRKETD